MQGSADHVSLTFAGVDLVPTGRGGFYVRILSGMVGKGEPLYVIDGAPMKISPTVGITWFKPDDIKEIKVLKEPFETSVYGSKGTNGVIVIGTKQARKPPQ
jgi:TonB-dependent SusC/RagA subfamily outer membrane receptor